MFFVLKLTHEAKTQARMYILCLFKAVYISHDLSLEKKGLECDNSILLVTIIIIIYHRLWLVSLTPVINTQLQISPQIFIKICNGPVDTGALGEKT